MAIRVIYGVLNANINVDKAQSFHAGACLARESTTSNGTCSQGNARLADRASDPGNAFVGFAADDKARSGNTMIQPDPVGATYVDPATGNMIKNNNGLFVAQKRALGDWQDETVTNVSDLTSGASGYEGPRRGVGIYTTPSNVLITDQFGLFQTSAATTDIAYAAFVPNDLLTFGASTTNAMQGKLVMLSNTSHGKAIARVDSYDASAGLLYITQL
jgi:hypothetical protein